MVELPENQVIEKEVCKRKHEACHKGYGQRPRKDVPVDDQRPTDDREQARSRQQRGLAGDRQRIEPEIEGQHQHAEQCAGTEKCRQRLPGARHMPREPQEAPHADAQQADIDQDASEQHDRQAVDRQGQKKLHDAVTQGGQQQQETRIRQIFRTPAAQCDLQEKVDDGKHRLQPCNP